MKKKLFALLTVTILTTALLPVSVYAHGHGHRGGGGYGYYATCVTEGCSIAGVHQHGNVSYAGHYPGDGHNYHNGNHGGWRHN